MKNDGIEERPPLKKNDEEARVMESNNDERRRTTAIIHKEDLIEERGERSHEKSDLFFSVYGLVREAQSEREVRVWGLV